ncbi:hypothetical protein ACEN2J_14465 [Pseudorhodobacter sp. W20_MBD10_FR17]|uniref:hypothetical protein n=1 Tax=Pseudorhodobacter sp. W20_MBD10_FR17 TaxID=3240266 RepID=UPI003F9A385F
MTTQVQYDPARLTALAGIARKANSARSGMNDELHDQRDARRDLQARINRVRQMTITGDAAAAQSSAEEAKRLEAELADLNAEITVREVELDEVAEAAASARANLKSALKFAKSEGLSIPTALAEEAQNA